MFCGHQKLLTDWPLWIRKKDMSKELPSCGAKFILQRWIFFSNLLNSFRKLGIVLTLVMYYYKYHRGLRIVRVLNLIVICFFVFFLNV